MQVRRALQIYQHLRFYYHSGDGKHNMLTVCDKYHIHYEILLYKIKMIQQNYVILNTVNTLIMIKYAKP